jgi:hypothetical protein
MVSRGKEIEMSEDLIVQTNGPYLRVVLPDFDPNWTEVWRVVDFELEDGIERAEVVSPAYPGDECVDAVRRLIRHLEQRGVHAVVEWEGIPPEEKADARAIPV